MLFCAAVSVAGSVSVVVFVTRAPVRRESFGEAGKAASPKLSQHPVALPVFLTSLSNIWWAYLFHWTVRECPVLPP